MWSFKSKKEKAEELYREIYSKIEKDAIYLKNCLLKDKEYILENKCTSSIETIMFEANGKKYTIGVSGKVSVFTGLFQVEYLLTEETKDKDSISSAIESDIRVAMEKYLIKNYTFKYPNNKVDVHNITNNILREMFH